jgi:hypothetical protein
VHLYRLGAARLGVAAGERRGDGDHRARELLQSLGIADDDVAARDATADMNPDVVRLCHLEGEEVVLGVAPSDEDLEAVHVHGSIRTPLARHFSLCPRVYAIGPARRSP